MAGPDYALAQQIGGLHVPDAITVVGTGGTGSWVALFAALAGCPKIVLFDGSTVKETDLARLPLEVGSLGTSKPEAVKAAIHRLRPQCQITVFARRFVYGSDEPSIEGTLFNCADNMEAAKKLAQHALDHGIRYVTAPYSGLAAGVYDHCPDNHHLSGKPEPSWVGGGALAASLAVTAAFGTSFNTVVCPTLCNLPKDELESRIVKSMGAGSM